MDPIRETGRKTNGQTEVKKALTYSLNMLLRIIGS